MNRVLRLIASIGIAAAFVGIVPFPQSAPISATPSMDRRIATGQEADDLIEAKRATNAKFDAKWSERVAKYGGEPISRVVRHTRLEGPKPNERRSRFARLSSLFTVSARECESPFPIMFYGGGRTAPRAISVGMDDCEPEISEIFEVFDYYDGPEDTQALETFFTLIEGSIGETPMSWSAEYESLFRGEELAGGEFDTDEFLTENEYYSYDGEDFADCSEVDDGSVSLSLESEDGGRTYLGISCEDTGAIARKIHWTALTPNPGYAAAQMAGCMVNGWAGGGTPRARLGKCAAYTAGQLAANAMRIEAGLWANYLFACLMPM
jgi:hypothetical protein